MVPHHRLDADRSRAVGIARCGEEVQRPAIRFRFVERAPRPIALNDLGTGDTFIHGWVEGCGCRCGPRSLARPCGQRPPQSAYGCHRLRQFLPIVGRSGCIRCGVARRGPVRPRVRNGFGNDFSCYVCFLRVGLLNEREIVRGRTITQVKMLHDPYPVDQLLGQISGSNCWSNSLVEFVGQIHGSNLSVKLLVEFTDQIHWSNCWVKFADQILWSNAGNPRLAADQPRRTHGRARAWPENGQGRTGNGQRKAPRCDARGL